MAWGLLIQQQGRVPEDISGGKARPARKADNPTTIWKPIV
jgi:hypothetical protein